MGTVRGSHARFAIGVHSHFKLKRAGSLAGFLWMRAIVYCNGQPALDGRVPLDLLADLLADVARGDLAERDRDGNWKPLTPRDVLERAIEVRLFDRIEVDHAIGEFAPVHDYLDHNKSGAERAAESEHKAEAAHQRHAATPPTARDPSTGKYSTRRAAASQSHGDHRAERTGPSVPTSTSDTSTTVPTPSNGDPAVVPADDDKWVSYGPEWDLVRTAMAERGYRLPPMGGPDVEGTQRKVLFDLIYEEGPEGVAARMRAAPHHLRAPAAFYDLVHWLLADRDARLDAIGPDPAPRPRERSSNGAAEPLADIMSRTFGTNSAKAVNGDAGGGEEADRVRV